MKKKKSIWLIFASANFLLYSKGRFHQMVYKWALSLALTFISFNLFATDYYSYQTGDWDAADIWTTDPSGGFLIPGGIVVIGAGDNVTILDGRTITISAASKSCASLTINSSGVINLGTTTSHNFGTVSGTGLMRIGSANFPAGTFTNFVSAAGGTIEYYNFGAPTTLPNQTTYNNLKLTNSTGSTYTIRLNNPANPTVYTINGTLSLLNTGAGSLTLSLGAGGANVNVINLSVYGNISIGSNCTMNVTTTTAAVTHNLYCYADFTNNGVVDLSNSAQYVAATNGAANLTFMGTTDNTLTCNGQTDIYVLTVNKGVDQTYVLTVTANDINNLKLFSNSKTLIITVGTLRICTNILITRVTVNSGTNYDISDAQNANGCLWIDGARFELDGSTNAVVVYGKFRMTAGNFTVGNQGLCIREDGEIIFEGGTSTIEKFRPSNIAAIHRGSFTMTGGTLTVDGSLPGSSDANQPRFCHPYSTQIFIMSGGTINISNPEVGPAATNGGILLGSSSGNYSVTGGTINITIPASATHFTINSTVPFWDLNILKSGAGAGTARLEAQPHSIPGLISPIAAQPLVVLNDFTLNTGNSPVFNASGYNVTLNGDFTINASTTFTPGANTTTFNGSVDQTLTNNGTITTGINNLTVNKTAGTLFLAGTAATYNVLSALTLSGGTFNDGGKTVYVAGNITNSAVHAGTGKITLNKTTGSQTITGSGSGIFENLELDNTNGAAGSTQVYLTSNMTINGILTFTSARLLSISNKNLTFTADASVTGAGTNQFILTSGYPSDGGVSKVYNSTTPFTFTVGTSNSGVNYTPAVIQINNDPTTYGTVTVRPVPSTHPFGTCNQRLTYYWRVTSSGFTGLGTADISHTYYYGTAFANGGDATYVPGVYVSPVWTYINDLTQVNEASQIIYFTNVDYLDGEFTAGRTCAFGVVTIYYSMASGDWDVGTTWSNTSNVGPTCNCTPPGNPNQSPVIIGDGATNNHTITISAGGRESSSLQINAGSTLDCQGFNNHNFGASAVNGTGKLRISRSTYFPAGDFSNFIGTFGGTVEYYGGPYTLPSVSDAPSSIPLTTYNNLILSTSAGILTMPNIDLILYGDMTISNYAPIVALNTTVAHNITIQGDLTVNGNLRFDPNFLHNMVTDGDVTVAAGAGVTVNNAGANLNTFSIGGTLTNNGNFDMRVSATRRCNVTFTGSNDESITGTVPAATMEFNYLTINKGTSQTPVLTLDFPGTLTTLSDQWLTLTNGTFRLSKAVALTLTNTAVSFSVPSTSCLSLNNAGGSFIIGNINNDAGDLSLAGKLEIIDGLIRIGLATYPANNNDIEYAATGTPEINIQNGSLYVNGQIRRSTTGTTGALVYNQSGGTVTIGGRAMQVTRAMLEIENSGSVFNMSGGSLILVGNGNQGTTYGDLFLNPEISNVTAGTVQFGNTNSLAGRVFLINSTASLWHVSIDATTSTKTAQLNVNGLSIKGNLTINGNSVFNANGLDVSIAGNLTNNNTTATSGVTVGGYRAGTVSQTTTFNSSTGSQSISGVATPNLTNFGNLVINNTFPGGVVSLQNNTATRVNGNLTLSEGTLDDGTNTITVLLNMDNSSTHTSGTGNITLAGVSGSQTISGDGSGIFGNLILNNGSGFNMTAAMTVNKTLTFTNGILNIYDNLLSLGVNSIIGGVPGATKMIVTNGVISDGGVIKSYPAAPLDFTFPIGVLGKYTPARLNVTANFTTGTINIKPVNSRHPLTSDPLNLELTYYWIVNATGFSGYTISHTYNYNQTDVNGTETNYITGRLYNTIWNKYFGTVDAALNTMTLTAVDFISGEYTAGELSEFGAVTWYYSRNATSGGAWNDGNNWSTDGVLQHAGAAAGSFPVGNPVVIASGHTVSTNGNSRNAYSLQNNGILELGSTYGHYLGFVSGTGTIKLNSSVGGLYTLPAGDYSSFVSAAGGTIWYESSVTDATLPSQATYNNILFAGSSKKTISTDITVNGNLSNVITYDGFGFPIPIGELDNLTNNRNISLKGNWTNDGVYTAGTGTVTLNGTTTQTINGAANTSFYNLTKSGTASLTIGDASTSGKTILISNTWTWTDNNDNITVGNGQNVTFDVQNAMVIPAGCSLTSTNNGTINVGGSWTNNGTFTHGNGSVALDGAAVAKNINGSSGTVFYNLQKNYAAALTIGDAVTAGTLTKVAGAWSWTDNNDLITVENVQTATFEVDGDMTINAGCTFTSAAALGTIKVGGAWTNSAGTFNCNTGTVIFDATGGTPDITTGGTVAGKRFYKVTLDAATGVRLVTNPILIQNDFTINNGDWNANGQSMTVTGNWTNNGSFTHGNGSVIMNGIGKAINGSAGTTFYNLNKNATGLLTIGDATASGNTIKVTNTWTWTDNNDQITVGNGQPVTFEVDGAITIPAGCILSSQATATIKVGGNWVNSGTFTSGLGTVIFDPSAAIPTINTGGTTAAKDFDNVKLDITSVSGTGVRLLTNIMYINKDFEITSGDWNANALAMRVTGNWSNNGTFTPNANTVTFNGSAVQNISGTSVTGFYNLILNNTTARPLPTDLRGLILNRNIGISNILTMTDGDIDLNGFNINLGTAGSIASETNDKRIAGTTGIITTTRNINAPAALNVGGMGAVLTSGANLGSTTIERCHTVQTGLGNQSIFRYYNINPTNNSGLNATLRFYYFNNELNGQTEANFDLYRSTDGGSTWSAQNAPTTDYTNNYVEKPAIDAFSRWTISNKTTNPLPIELLYFSATCDYNKVILSWATASETNNDYYTPERSNDGISFEPLPIIYGAGNSNDITLYSVSDNTLSNPDPINIYYYRLRQTDFDGNSTCSEIITVSCLNNYGYLENIVITNDPDASNIDITFTSGDSDMYIIEMTDGIGRVVFCKKFIPDHENSIHSISKFGFASGIYNLIVRSKSGQTTKQIVINRN